MTTRVHSKKEPYDVYIGRPSIWGNPWSHLKSDFDVKNVETREEACANYHEWITEGAGVPLLRSIHELRGKTLGCFCGEDQECHGDTLIWLADMKKVGIIGSRSFTDEQLAFDKIFELMSNMNFAVVSGGAKGADTIAKEISKATVHRIFIEFLPDWDEHGKAAGFIRNQQIVDASDIIVAFWDGKSNGTRDSIRKAQVARKDTHIFYI